MASIATSAHAPSPSALNGDNLTTSRPSSSLPRPPQLPQFHHATIATPILPVNYSSPITPHTTSTAASSPAFAARNVSNASSPNGTPLLGTADGSRGRFPPYTLASPVPLELGESAMAVPANVNSPNGVNANDVVPNNNNSKGNGLIRRISRGAANKLTRRRPSASHHDKRDHSSGPVIMRRRSDSKSRPFNGRESGVDSSFDDEDNDAFDSFTTTWCGSESTSVTSELPVNFSGEAAAVAPKMDSVLQRGTVLTKVTKKKNKQLRFFLDLDATKVFWDVSNPAKRFYIDDIKEVRVGSDARNYREEHQFPIEVESRWFTIIFAHPDNSKGKPAKTMHLITPDDFTLELWTTTLEYISRYRIGLMTGLAGPGQSDAVLKAHWQREMLRLFPRGLKPGEPESLDFPAIESVCRSLHINCSRNMLRAQFTKADVGGNGSLDFAEFKDFLGRLKDRKDVKAIFKELARDPKEGLSLSEFLSFLRTMQKEDVGGNEMYWTSVFERVIRRSKPRSTSVPEPVDVDRLRMNVDAFSSFLRADSNGIYASQPSSKWPFDRPLNEYFISSSHNTYLLGRQVAGASSTEAYITALQQGCRCVEIDCWDGTDGRPIVSHGRTLTTSVLFADCISVINRYAFLSSDFPLILSLEVHCSSEQQLAMVKIMKETFGDRLVLEPLPDCALLPSPEDLKNRILVKVKTCDETEGLGSSETFPVTGRKRSASSPFVHAPTSERPRSGSMSPLSSPSSVTPPVDPATAQWGPGMRSLTTTSLSSATEDSDGAQVSIKREKSRRQKSKISKPLSDLGVYTRGYKWHSFQAPESKRYNHVFSFAERSFESIYRDADNKPLLEEHNKKFLTRVYPSGFRLWSSNFDPISFWRSGVQMAAVNWQTYDVGMQLNQAMFAAGIDRTGYVLKPESLRRSAFDSSADSKNDRSLVRFSIEMISAQQLPRPRRMGPEDNINPYIEIEVFSGDDRGQCIAFGEGGQNISARNGLSGLGLPHRRRTKIEHSNGYSPIFNNSFSFSIETKYPDLIFVRWTVWNSPDGHSSGTNNCIQLASFTAKLSSLSQGYRYLPLFDIGGDQYLFSTLFCKISKEAPTPVQRLQMDELKSERGGGIFRHLGQNVFKLGLSTERERELERISTREERQDAIAGKT